MSNLLDDFLREFGLFIMEFASTESFLLSALTETAGVSHDTARAIFSGVKADTAKSFINRLRELKDVPPDPILTRAFAQFTLITNVRNDLVHYGPKFVGNWEAVATNEFLAMPGRARSAGASPEDLRAMTNDLQTIRSAILVCLVNTEAEPETLAAIKEAAQRPWRYIQK